MNFIPNGPLRLSLPRVSAHLQRLDRADEQAVRVVDVAALTLEVIPHLRWAPAGITAGPAGAAACGRLTRMFPELGMTSPGPAIVTPASRS